MGEFEGTFDRLDVNNSGYLTWNELCDRARSLKSVSALQMELSFKEVVAIQAMRQAMENEESALTLKAIHDSSDKDDDGRVSSKEWGKHAASTGKLKSTYFKGLSAKELGGAFKRLDTNGNGVLSWEEFSQALVNEMQITLQDDQGRESQIEETELNQERKSSTQKIQGYYNTNDDEIDDEIKSLQREYMASFQVAASVAVAASKWKLRTFKHSTYDDDFDEELLLLQKAFSEG